MIKQRDMELSATDSEKAEGAYIPKADTAFNTVNMSSHVDDSSITFYNQSACTWLTVSAIFATILLFTTGLLIGRYACPAPVPAHGPFGDSDRAACTFEQRLTGVVSLYFISSTSRLETGIQEKLIGDDGFGEVKYYLTVMNTANLSRCLNLTKDEVLDFSPPEHGRRQQEDSEKQVTGELGVLTGRSMSIGENKYLGELTELAMDERHSSKVDSQRNLLGYAILVYQKSGKEKFHPRACCVIAHPDGNNK